MPLTRKKWVNRLLLIAFVAALGWAQQASSQTKLGLTFTDQELDLWYQRSVSGPFKVAGDFSANSPGDWQRITNNKNSWEANKAADRYNKVFRGSLTTNVPQDQGGQYDPANTSEKIRDAAFYYAIQARAPGGGNAGVRAAAAAGKRAVIVEILKGYVNIKYKYGNDSIRAFDWLGTPKRWQLGGMADVNPSFVIPEWLTRLIFAWDFAKDQATDGEKATFNEWIRGSVVVVGSWLDKGLNTHFSSRTGTIGSYPIKPEYNIAALTNGQDRIHKDYKIANKIAAYRNNRRRAMAAYRGIAGFHLGDKTLIDQSYRDWQEFLAYGFYPDLSYVDFQRSHDKDSHGTLKPSQGYSYSIQVPWIVLADIAARAGDTRFYEASTALGTTTAQAGSNGNTSDGVTQKNLLNTIQTMIGIHNGTINRYSPVSPYPRIGPINLNGQEICSYFVYLPAQKYYQNSTVGTFLNRAIPGNRAPAGAIDVNTLGGYAGLHMMFKNNTINVYPSQQPVDSVKQAQTITLQDPPDRDYSPGEYFTVVATSTSGLPVTITLVDGPGTIAGNVITITGAGTLTIKATQAGNGSYLPATPLTTHTVIRRAPQTITAAPLMDQIFPGSITVVASASSGLPVTTTGTANLTQTGAYSYTLADTGQAVVYYSQPGDANYQPATPVERMFRILPAETPTENVTLLTESQATQTSVRTLGTGGKYFYRFTSTWPVFGSPKQLTGLLMLTGYQTGKPVFNNRLVNYKYYVRLVGAGPSEWTLWLYDDVSQKNDIDRGIGISNVIQVRRQSDGQDPRARVKESYIYGHDQPLP